MKLIVSGRGCFVLKEKLRLLKSRLKWWNINIFDKIDLEIEEGVREMNEYDGLSLEVEVEAETKREVNKKFWFNLKIKENMRIQRARIKWLNKQRCQ